MDEKFRKAEEEYFILRGKFDTGRIGKNLFELALKDMAVQDTQGRWWMIGADTGNWYMHDGKSWVQADPSHENVVQTPTTPAPRTIPGSSASGTGSSKTPIYAVIGCVAIICLGLAGIGGYFVLNPNLRPSSNVNAATLAARISPVALTTPAITGLPTPSAIAALATDTPVLPTDTPVRTRIPIATSTPVFPPGIYVLSIRTDPSPAKRRDEIVFYPTFFNFTGAPTSYRIVIQVWRPGETHSMGESFANNVTMPLGQSEQQAPGWRLTGPGGCEDFILHVGWVDDQKRFTSFTRTTGQAYEQGLTVCP